MAAQLDVRLFDEIGLGTLSDADKASLLADMTAELHMRVGASLAADLTDDELDEFKTLSATDQSGARAQAWLRDHLPEYPDVVAAKHRQLVDEVQRRASEIIEVVTQPPHQTPQEEAPPHQPTGSPPTNSPSPSPSPSVSAFTSWRRFPPALNLDLIDAAGLSELDDDTKADLLAAGRERNDIVYQQLVLRFLDRDQLDRYLHSGSDVGWVEEALPFFVPALRAGTRILATQLAERSDEILAVVNGAKAA